jgi:hypothetical protein
MRARWDGDTRGHGVGDAGQLVAGANELIAAFTQRNWVAEQPEDHLLPHVEAWCHQDQRLSITGTSVDDRNAYVVDLEWRGPSAGVGQARAAVFALIGSFAETATYVRQRRDHSQRCGTPLAAEKEGTVRLRDQTGKVQTVDLTQLSKVDGIESC